MCQINEQPLDTMECNCKQVCCKMQKKSLRIATDALKKHKQFSGTLVLNTLSAIYNLLSVYSCLPGTCLLKRVLYIQRNIKSGDDILWLSEETNVNMLIEELEAFLSSNS